MRAMIQTRRSLPSWASSRWRRKCQCALSRADRKMRCGRPLCDRRPGVLLCLEQPAFDRQFGEIIVHRVAALLRKREEDEP